MANLQEVYNYLQLQIDGLQRQINILHDTIKAIDNHQAELTKPEVPEKLREGKR